MWLVWEDASSYHQLVQGAQVCKVLTILIHLSQSVCSHGALVTSVVCSDLGISRHLPEVSRQYSHVFGSFFVYHRL